MTIKPAGVPIEADRELYHKLTDYVYTSPKGPFLDGEAIYMIARHRIAALQQSRSAVIEECAKLVEAELVELDSNHPDTIDNVRNAIIGDLAKAIRALSQRSADA